MKQSTTIDSFRKLENNKARGDDTASAYIPPDDFDEMQLPASTAEGVIPRENSNSNSNTHVKVLPPPTSTVDFSTPYQ